MFRLVFLELKDSILFEGKDKKFLSLNCKSLEKGEYYEAGKIIALSLIHVGQGPHFFSDVLFSAIVHGIHNAKPVAEFIDQHILETVYKVGNISSLDKLQEMVINEPIFGVAGIYFTSSLEEKEDIIERTLRFYNFYRIKAALDQFIEGLKIGDVYDLMVKHPDLFYPLMCSEPPALTAEIMINLFEVVYSCEGSNIRDAENRTISYWRDYLMDCEEVEDEDGVTLKEILIFATGASSIPPLGFSTKPVIQFMHTKVTHENLTDVCKKRYFPEANTCALQIHLPVFHKDYCNFELDMDFAITNSKMFGKA
ncbi:hypothetical protein Zmor_003767 [Zophobas morio]|uniref:HECT domain-containing protein n=1 Tax=Zophobas morio TaxID=2755281 RepID=A0AA38HM69_9CUCU|nr:hypothetical protein Zmor_003767 [Zophobas morio]